MSASSITPAVIICQRGYYGGCGEPNSPYNENCAQCARLLWINCPISKLKNSTGDLESSSMSTSSSEWNSDSNEKIAKKYFFLGQGAPGLADIEFGELWFLRQDKVTKGQLERGIIVDIKKRSIDQQEQNPDKEFEIKVRYLDPSYRFECYDETVPLDEIFCSASEVPSRGRERKRTRVEEIAPTKPVKSNSTREKNDIEPVENVGRKPIKAAGKGIANSEEIPVVLPQTKVKKVKEEKVAKTVKAAKGEKLPAMRPKKEPSKDREEFELIETDNGDGGCEAEGEREYIADGKRNGECSYEFLPELRSRNSGRTLDSFRDVPLNGFHHNSSALSERSSPLSELISSVLLSDGDSNRAIDAYRLLHSDSLSDHAASKSASASSSSTTSNPKKSESENASSSASETSSQLDRFYQRALIHYFHNIANPKERYDESTQSSSSSSSSDSLLTSSGVKAAIGNLTVSELEEIVWRVPADLLELSRMACYERIRELGAAEAVLSIVRRFLDDRLKPVERYLAFSSALLDPTSVAECDIKPESDSGDRHSPESKHENNHGRGNKMSNGQIDDEKMVSTSVTTKQSEEEENEMTTLEQLRAKFPRMRLPLSVFQFNVIMKIAFARLGGRENFEGTGGGSNSALTTTSDGMPAMYGGVNENLIEEIIERSRMNRASRFIDVGSGIGQICIQVAATAGCETIGFEVIPSRHRAALRLRRAFVETLREAEVEGWEGLSERIMLVCLGFQENSNAFDNATHIFFNNFGPWFDSQNPDKTPGLNQVFADKTQWMQNGVHIFTMKSLAAVDGKLHVESFKSAREATTWNKNRLNVYHYRKLQDGWNCPRCTFYIELVTVEICPLCSYKSKSNRNSNATKDVTNR